MSDYEKDPEARNSIFLDRDTVNFNHYLEHLGLPADADDEMIIPAMTEDLKKRNSSTFLDVLGYDTESRPYKLPKYHPPADRPDLHG